MNKVTIILCTRNRGNLPVNAVNSILANDYNNFELLVVDQSDDDKTKKSIEPFLNDKRFRYFHSNTIGLAVAQNIGINQANTELIAITDDDCEVPTDWLHESVKAFEVDEKIGIVFGNVIAGEHDERAGFIPSYFRIEPSLARSIKDKHLVEGIGACMCLRRSVWQRLEGFDEMLGPGSRFKSGVETDFTMRALLKGYYVYETPRVHATHYGFRKWDEAKILVQNYLYGTGAAFGKLLKCGHFYVPVVLLFLAWRLAFGKSPVKLGGRGYRIQKLFSFVRGFCAAIISPVSRHSGHFAKRLTKII